MRRAGLRGKVEMSSVRSARFRRVRFASVRAGMSLDSLPLAPARQVDGCLLPIPEPSSATVETGIDNLLGRRVLRSLGASFLNEEAVRAVMRASERGAPEAADSRDCLLPRLPFTKESRDRLSHGPDRLPRETRAWKWVVSDPWVR